jgi:hypothetical protein
MSGCGTECVDFSVPVTILAGTNTCIGASVNLQICGIDSNCTSTAVCFSWKTFHSDGTTCGDLNTIQHATASGPQVKQPATNNHTEMLIYPNPAGNGVQTISVDYVAQSTGTVKAYFYTSTGRLVGVHTAEASAGERVTIEFPFDRACNNGLYFCRISQGNSVETKEIAVVR